MNNGQIILFQTQGGETKIEVRLANESMWLTADQMAELFQRNRSTIQRYIKRIYPLATIGENRNSKMNDPLHPKNRHDLRPHV